MAKTPAHDWKSCRFVAILCALSLFPRTLLLAGSKTPPPPGGLRLELEEAKLARAAAEGRVTDLEADVRRAERDLEALRRQYADLYLESRRQLGEREHLELRVAGLLTDHEDPSSGRALSRALAALAELRKHQRRLGELVRAFSVYLPSVLDVLQPSEALRRELMARVTDLLEAAERAERPLSEVAGRGSGHPQGRACRVLAVSDELQVVVLDAGSRDGVRLGTYWRYTRDDKTVAKLRIIETRPSISAAVVVEGRFKMIAPGVLMQPGG